MAFWKASGYAKDSNDVSNGTVGHFLVGVQSDYVGYEDIGFFSFSVGTVFFFLVFVGLFQNLNRLPKRQREDPVLFLFIAPPAAASLSAATLFGDGSYGSVAKFYYFLGLFLYLLLLRLVRYFVQAKFSVAWWAYTFPMSITGTAALSHVRTESMLCFKIIAAGLAGIATLWTLVILVRSIISAFQHELFVDPVVKAILRDGNIVDKRKTIDLNCQEMVH